MPQVIKSVLVSHSAEDMFDLVDAVEHYAVFLPWCSGATVHSRDSEHTQATINIRYMGVVHSLTTHNKKRRPMEMTLALVEGPFKNLGGAWHFTTLTAAACKVEFSLSYTFANAVMEEILGQIMLTIAETFVDRFAARADELALQRQARLAAQSSGGVP